MATKKKTTKKKNGIKSEAVADIREIRSLIKEAIDSGAENVEQVHQAIAKMPFKYLEKIDMLENAASKVKEAQEKTIGQVYKTLKKFNDKVDDMAEEMLKKVEG